MLADTLIRRNKSRNEIFLNKLGNKQAMLVTRRPCEKYLSITLKAKIIALTSQIYYAMLQPSYRSITLWPMRLFLLYSSAVAAPSGQEQALAQLDRISQPQSIQTEFVYSSQDKQGEIGPTLQGEVLLQGEQYCLYLDHQEIVCNGITTWTYLKDVNEVQVVDSRTDTSIAMFCRILMHYRQDYTFVHYHEITIDNNSYDVVKMIAKDQQCPASQIITTVHRGTGHLHTLEVIDQDHTQHRLLFANFSTGEAVDEILFTFMPEDYEDIEVIDMR